MRVGLLQRNTKEIKRFWRHIGHKGTKTRRKADLKLELKPPLSLSPISAFQTNPADRDQWQWILRLLLFARA